MEATQKFSKNLSAILSTGLAMFAMFFGAGNIVFPLALGQMTQDKNAYAVLGMILTAVIVPLAGVLAMMLYRGDYASFFSRIGKIPGFIITLLILGLIGPFGGIPRCIAISHSTLAQFGMPLNLISFSLISCLLVFLFTFRPNKILALLGYVLTPILLGSLGFIAIKGFFSSTDMGMTTLSRWDTFSEGLLGGYNTMDLLAAFFFSSVVLICLRKNKEDCDSNKGLVITAIFASLIAAFLLALVYISFSFLAAQKSTVLSSFANHEILGVLAHNLLGPYAGLIAGVAVAFACLTTEIALAAVLAEFLRKTVFKEKVRFELTLGLTLLVSFAVSTLHFEGISLFLVPILQIFYPALIVLTILNVMYKLFDFKPVKLIFYGTFVFTLLAYCFTR